MRMIKDLSGAGKMNVNQLSGLLRSGFFFLGFCPQTALSFKDALKQSFGRLLSSCFLACPGDAAGVNASNRLGC